MGYTSCTFFSLSDTFNFGQYNGLSIADVLDIDPSYIDWCVKNCTSVDVVFFHSAIEEIKQAYPKFIMDELFESKLNSDFSCCDEDDYEEDDSSYTYHFEDEDTDYGRYAGTWAQDEAGYSDDDIDTIFDGDPSAYWNID